MIINMSQEEVRTATMIAMQRWLEKFGSQDRPNYAQGKAEGKLEHELLANVRANICEWAVAKAYNLTWNMPWYPNNLHPQRKDLADVGSNVEVRSIRTQSSIPFWKKDSGKWIVGSKVLDTEYYTQAEVFGRIFADDFMTDEYYDSYISGWRVPVEKFAGVGDE